MVSAFLEQSKVQRFENLFDPTPTETLTVEMALEEILTGTYRETIQDCRRTLATRGKDAYTAAKNHLPQWTFAGTFAPKRAKDHLVQHSGLVHADIDHLATLAETKLALMRDPHVLYCFTSPSGDGLKYGVRITIVADDDAYKHAWAVLAAAHLEAYKVTWDPSGKDICRLCFVSWDPACYVNPDAEVYPVPPPMVIPAPPRVAPALTEIPRERRERYARQAIAAAVKIIDDSVEGGLHDARCRASVLLGGYVAGGVVTQAEAYDALKTAVDGKTKHLAAALRTIQSGLKKGADTPITLEKLEADWERWKEARTVAPRAARAVPDMTRRLSTTPTPPRHLTSTPLRRTFNAKEVRP